MLTLAFLICETQSKALGQSPPRVTAYKRSSFLASSSANFTFPFYLQPCRVLAIQQLWFGHSGPPTSQSDSQTKKSQHLHQDCRSPALAPRLNCQFNATV